MSAKHNDNHDGSESVQFIRDPFFSLYKLFWWLVYTLMLIGFATLWVFVNVKVLGNDPGISLLQSERFPAYEQGG